jgi:beta-barrel assembly-enhancing protease
VRQPRTLVQEIVLLAALTVLIAALSYTTAELVRIPLKKASKGIDSVPVAWENRLKNEIVKYLETDSKLLDDKVVLDAVESIRKRLLANEPDTTYKIEILVVESDVVNAVTFPGGLIVVFVPLIKVTSCPEELASVLAHEIGHVVHRDPLRQMAKELGVSTVLAMVNGGKPAPVIQTMIKDFINIQYTREQEREADEYGLALLAKSGISPAYFGRFMDKLAPDTTAEKGNDEAFEYLSTHPDVHERVDSAFAAGKRFDNKMEKPFKIDWKNVKKRLPSVFDE